MYFVVSGQVCQVVEATAFGFLDTLALVICNQVPDMLGGVYIPLMPQLIPSDIITRMITRAWRNVQPSASIDFEAVELLMNKPNFIGSKTIVMAPTGVGKSTRMIARMAALTSRRRIIVIEPRHILVTGLCDYMNQVDPTTGYGASTTGRTPSQSDRVIYCTYQSMVLCGYGKDTDIVVVDEAHIKDPIYKFAVEDMLTRNCTTLLVTATPDPAWEQRSINYIELQVAPIWRVVEHVITLGSITAYSHQVIQMCRNLGPNDKVLIFMPTTRQCAMLLEQLPGHGVIISSKHPAVDLEAQYFVSTRVSDAGITLPDVAFVFTMDIEWGVSVDIADDQIWAPTTSTQHYRLDELTVKQRKGRTGRTCDGTFFLFHIEGNFDQRKTTPKDLLMELVDLLDMPHIQAKLPPNAMALFEKYQEGSMMLGGGDITPQSLFPAPAHYRNPSEYRRANTQISVNYGMSTTLPIVSFDPLKGKNMMPGRDLTDRGAPVRVEEEDVEALAFWGLMPTTTDEEDVHRAKELQVVGDHNPDVLDDMYEAPYDDQINEYSDSSEDEYLSAEEN